MSNIWSLFEDYEKRYHGWLKESAIPKTTQWYQQSGIDQRLQNLQTGLLGEQRWDPSGTKRVGGSLETAGGVIKDYVTRPDVRTMHPTEGVQVGKQLQSPFQRDISKAGVKSLEVTRDVINWGVDKANSVYDKMFPNANKNISTDKKKKLISEKMKTLPPQLGGLSTKGQAEQFTDQDASSLAKFAGVNLKDAAKAFKDKGGFEGLMSNPAFTLGLALMQSSAQGKNIGQGVMDNFIKAAGISDHYKDRIQARKDRLAAKGEIIGPPTEEQMGLIERVLESKKFKTNYKHLNNIVGKYVFGKDKEAQYHSTVSAIAAKVNEKAREDEEAGKRVQLTEDYIASVVNQMVADKELAKGKGVTEGFWASPVGEFIGGYFGKGRQELLKKKKGLAEGGPAQAGESYVVGEKGPEVFTPNVTGTVTANDDAQVMGMLLASNPQLQNVSKARAESILRSRFPDYFA